MSADQKKQREHLRTYTAAARALELHEIAINVLESASTVAGQRAIRILKTDQQRLVKALDAAAAKLGAPYPAGVRVDAKPVAWLDSFGEPHRRREDAWDGDPESAEPRPLYEHPPTPGVAPSPAHSKSEYKRRVALGDPNVAPPAGVLGMDKGQPR